MSKIKTGTIIQIFESFYMILAYSNDNITQTDEDFRPRKTAHLLVLKNYHLTQFLAYEDEIIV